MLQFSPVSINICKRRIFWLARTMELELQYIQISEHPSFLALVFPNTRLCRHITMALSYLGAVVLFVGREPRVGVSRHSWDFPLPHITPDILYSPRIIPLKTSHFTPVSNRQNSENPALRIFGYPTLNIIRWP